MHGLKLLALAAFALLYLGSASDSHAATDTLKGLAPGAAEAAISAASGLSASEKVTGKRKTGATTSVVGTQAAAGTTEGTVTLDGKTKSTKPRIWGIDLTNPNEITTAINSAKVSASYSKAFGLCSVGFTGKAGVTHAQLVSVQKLQLPEVEVGVKGAAQGSCGTKWVAKLAASATAEAVVGVRPAATAGVAVEAYSHFQLRGTFDGWLVGARVLDLDWAPINRTRIHRRVLIS